MAKHYYSHEYRLLTHPLSNGYSKIICFKIESVWFAHTYISYKPVSLLVFENDNEFERFYKLKKRNFKNENKQNNIKVPDVNFRQGEELPF